MTREYAAPEQVRGELTAIDGVSFTLDKGERLGLVGESGAGKSVTGFAIINLISKPGYISGGSISFDGDRLDKLSLEAMRDIRGKDIGMIFATYGNVYVAKVALGANPGQVVKAFNEAEAYDGPSLFHAHGKIPTGIFTVGGQSYLIKQLMDLGLGQLPSSHPCEDLQVLFRTQIWVYGRFLHYTPQ